MIKRLVAFGFALPLLAGLGACAHKTEVVALQPAQCPAGHHHAAQTHTVTHVQVKKTAAHPKPSPWSTTVVNQYDQN